VKALFKELQMKLIRFSCILLLMFILPASSICFSQSKAASTNFSNGADGEAHESYTGKWIWQDEDGPANTWACFRKSFELGEVPVEAITRIAVDSKYWLWINEELVVFEGGLKQGPTPDDSYYDQLDVADYLKEGKNTIAVLVWYFGKQGFSHIDRGKGALFLECELNGTTLISDNTWKTKVHPAYEETSGTTPNFRLPESNVRFNAQKNTIGNWTALDYDDASWSNAVEKGTPPASPWGNLWLRPIPQWQNSGLIDYASLPVSLPYTTTKQTTLSAKLSYNAQVTPFLDIEAPSGLVIDIRTDAYEPSNRVYSVRAEYVTGSGSQQYESLGWMNGHIVYYTLPAGVTINALKYRETGYDCEFTGSFTCSDDFFNTLWTKAQRTLYINMRDTYTDCPDRERGLWWGDAVLEIGEAFYALDRKADLLAEKCISNMVEWQKSDYSLYAPVPAGNWDRELPAQTLASIGPYGFWTYYIYSGDTSAIMDAYPHVRNYLTIWSLDADGLVVHRGGGWNYDGPWGWTDWGSNIDERVIDNCWYYMALKAARDMALLTGNGADTAVYDEKILSIETNFNRVLWQGNYYKSPGYSGEVDDRANGLAVVAGLADGSQWPAIRAVLGQYRHASPYMEKYVLEALYLMEYENDALDRMKRSDRYAPMVYNDLTTLYENFGNDGSFNHGWSGGPLTLLSQYAAGIAPETAAFGTYHVFPREGYLSSIQSVTLSCKGTIEVDIEKNTSEYTLKLNSPSGTVAKVGIPKSPFTRTIVTLISVNNTEVWQDGSLTGTQEGVNYAGEDPEYYIFSVEPGEYSFSASLKDTATGKNKSWKIQAQ
jgi:alpha-L-rhamnosidase